ncbi:MAG: hypothetical protein ACREVE_10745 [Gammaproteobacteria bacterium]
MNTYIADAFRHLSWRALFVALLYGAALQAQAQARPADPTWIGPPVIRADDPPTDTDTRIWRYVPIGPRGTYRPVVRIVAQPPAPPREVERWVGPRGTVPIYRKD